MRHRNYRLWFWGQLISLFGTWMQITAQAFLVYQLTHSPTYLGLVGFAAGLPTWLFTLYGGVVSDRMSRKNLLIITQTTMMLLAFALAALTFIGVVQPWHIILLAFFGGIANAFDSPARQAFVFDMVPKEDLTNAVALNGTMFNISIILGPAIGGILYAILGPAWCFMINGISYLAIIVGLFLMNIPFAKKQHKGVSVLQDIREGLHYVRHHPILMGLIMMMASMGLFGMAFITLIPAWAVETLKGDATTNGLLQAARGVGALVIALWVASLGNFRFKGKLVMIGNFVLPLLIVIFSFIRVMPISMAILALIGMASLLINNVSTIMTQMVTEDRLRGRVMSVFALVFFGFMPFGSLWIGAAAELWGEQLAVIISGILSFLSAVLIWRFFPQLMAAE